MKEPYFDIQIIIDLIEEQEPERLGLIEQLQKSERQRWVRQPYVSLNSSFDGSNLKIEESIALEHETEGTIVLDIFQDGRIKGIEFVNQIPNK